MLISPSSSEHLLSRKLLADTYTYPISGPLVPLFWISGDVSSGATPANLLTADIDASHFPTCISRWECNTIVAISQLKGNKSYLIRNLSRDESDGVAQVWNIRELLV